MTRAARRACVRALLASCLAALPGCALLPPVSVDVRRSLWSPGAIDVPHRKHCASTLLVFPAQTRPVYDTTQMAYAERADEVAYFARQEWGETPSQMLLPPLRDALWATGCFAAVVTPPYTYHSTHALHTQIVELLQDFTAQPAVLRLSLRVQLVDDACGCIIADQVITLREPMSRRTPEAGVQAANTAAARAIQRIVSVVLAATSSARSRP